MLISKLIGRPGAYTDLRPSGHQFTLPGEDCPRWLACSVRLYLVTLVKILWNYFWFSSTLINCAHTYNNWFWLYRQIDLDTFSHLHILVCWRSFNYKAWYYWTFHIWRLAIHLPDEPSKTHRESEKIWQFPPRWCRRSYLRQSGWVEMRSKLPMISSINKLGGVIFVHLENDSDIW